MTGSKEPIQFDTPGHNNTLKGSKLDERRSCCGDAIRVIGWLHTPAKGRHQARRPVEAAEPFSADGGTVDSVPPFGVFGAGLGTITPVFILP
jgi:hypothetical protein